MSQPPSPRPGELPTQSADREPTDLIRETSSHDLTQAARMLGKCTSDVSCSVSPDREFSTPGTEFHGLKNTADKAMTIIPGDKAEECGGGEDGAGQDPWRTVWVCRKHENPGLCAHTCVTYCPSSPLETEQCVYICVCARMCVVACVLVCSSACVLCCVCPACVEIHSSGAAIASPGAPFSVTPAV